MGQLLDSVVFSIFVVFQFVTVEGLTQQLTETEQTETSCDEGWISLKDEKCLKIVSDEFLQYPNAEAYCNAMDSTKRNYSSLLSIKNEDEQIDVYNLLFAAGNVENNLWLGLKMENGSYTWPDGSPIKYANWINSSESDNNSKCVDLCVELNTEGKWLAVRCTRRNMFVCEKQQAWSLNKIQKLFQHFKREQLENPVPIGFIYVQLSGQPDPKVLWSAVKWEDITTKYAGLFFRAEGSGSAKFNDGEQVENSPRLVSVDSKMYKPSTEVNHVNIVYGGYTADRLITGDDKWGTVPSWHVRFHHSGGEVRPRNQAIRIWKRIQ